MKSIFTFCAVFTLSMVLNLLTYGSYAVGSGNEGIGTQVVVPNVYEDSAASGTFLGPLANLPRTYQLLINESELTNLLGQDLMGLSWRILPSATSPWPLADVTIANYDIYLSRSVAPANRSLTFANNVVGPQTLVRSGSLTIPDSSYSSGGNPNAFGPIIAFTTPYYYTGGHLLIEIRKSAFTGTSSSVEAVLASGGPPYGTLFSACWSSSYTGTTGGQGNFAIVRLTGDFPNPTLQLTALIEGFYDNVTNVMVSDTATVVVRTDVSPYTIVDQSSSVLDSTGRGFFRFLTAVSAVNYYLVATHRNSINTWTAAPQSFVSNSLSYDFTTANTQAFGNNLRLKGAEWTIFSGDILRDGFVDLSDIVAAFNDASIFATGYIVTDVNGDSFADLSDIVIVFNNASAFVAEIAP